LLLTFDTEDFISQNSISGLLVLLNKLEEHNFKALFFITGHMAEKLQENSQIVNLLGNHEIGYHSSGHSVRPTIFEFTDIESYEKAYQTSLTRETSHINPFSGEVEGKGGIFSLRKAFPSMQITAFRAPGFCWSPPHAEALRDLGIIFDFSSNISPTPFHYKGLTFYPYPTMGDWQGKISDYRLFSLSTLRHKITIAGLHPSLFVNQGEWDSIYWKENPKQLIPPVERRNSEIRSLFQSFDLFLKRLKYLEKIGLIETAPNLVKSDKDLTISEKAVSECYEFSIRWPKRLFKYRPKYLRNHFQRFFDNTVLRQIG
jgi:hypothetical protein